MQDLKGYDLKKWKLYSNYWLYDVDQREPDWKEVRKGRPSGSNCSSCIGRSKFSTPSQAALEISGKKTKEFTPEQLENMNFGTMAEPYARDWYSKSRGYQVEEIGFIVPKWDYTIGVSVDGDVLETDGIIEIKAPKKMYIPLKTYMERQSRGLVNPNDFSHIWPSHYDQMQMGMVITGKKWCDYIVYCIPENSVFVQRINFNQDHWNFMYNEIKSFISDKLTPLLEGTPYPLMPPIE